MIVLMVKACVQGSSSPSHAAWNSKNISLSLASLKMVLEVRLVLRKVDWVVKKETTLALSNGLMVLGLRTLRHWLLSVDHQLKLWPLARTNLQF